jgi:hypothetical protein
MLLILFTDLEGRVCSPYVRAEAQREIEITRRAVQNQEKDVSFLNSRSDLSPRGPLRASLWMRRV